LRWNLLYVAQTGGHKCSACLSLLNNWDYRHSADYNPECLLGLWPKPVWWNIVV
jgi:hypothetical protein